MDEKIRADYDDKDNWREVDLLREKNKALKMQNDLLKDRFDHLINGINDNRQTIDRLTDAHYHMAKDNGRKLNRIIEEIDAINIFIKNSKND